MLNKHCMGPGAHLTRNSPNLTSIAAHATIPVCFLSTCNVATFASQFLNNLGNGNVVTLDYEMGPTWCKSLLCCA